MITIHLDGVLLEVAEGSTLGSVVTDKDPACSVAIIRPGSQEKEKTENLQVKTTAGEVVIEMPAPGRLPFGDPGFLPNLKVHWQDRYSAAVGPFKGDFQPDRRPHLYERGDVILGCGGYDPNQSYLIFSRLRHSADHGAGSDGGVIGRVVSGRGVLDKWQTADKVTDIIPVIAWADTTRSYTTNNPSLPVEDRMQLVTHIDVMVQGYNQAGINTGTAVSVEHLLLALEAGRFHVERAASTHVFDGTMALTDVPLELEKPRREGTVTIRTKGQSRGGVYIYTVDVPGNPAHTVVGQVTHGIELAKLAREGDIFHIIVNPARFDLVGQQLKEALNIARERGIRVEVDNTSGGERVVVGQTPGTTLEALSLGKVSLATEPLTKVIDIELDDSAAPDSCDIFRRLTGLLFHNVGQLPAFFIFEDVFLFKPVIPTGIQIVPENTPTGEVPGGSLAITNEARKGVGLIGVRISSNNEFGPTSEPFEGTNIIGRVIDLEKLKSIREKDTVYIREIRK